MPLAAWSTLAWYGPAVVTGRIVGSGGTEHGTMRGLARVPASGAGGGVISSSHVTGLKTVPVAVVGSGGSAHGLLRARARVPLDVSIGSRPSAFDNAQAVVGQELLGLGISVGDALALLVRLLRNRTVTDPAAGVVRVYADDNATVLAAADLWEDAAGTQRYRGQGADRRDRLT